MDSGTESRLDLVEVDSAVLLMADLECSLEEVWECLAAGFSVPQAV